MSHTNFFLSETHLENFRGFSSLKINLAPEINYISGDNGQGKTTVLEAIRLLSTGRSFLTPYLKEIVRFDEKYFYTKGKIFKNGIPSEISFGLEFPQKKICINGESLSAASELIGKFDTVLFQPSDLEIVTGTPDKKRKFLDIQLCQGSKEYLKLLKSYYHVLKQRNSLLKQSFYPAELKAWTQKLVEYGSEIVRFRFRSVQALSAIASSYIQHFTPKKSLKISYKNFCDNDVENVEDRFHKLIEKQSIQEKEAGYTISGPHRDDLDFFLNGRNVKKYASRGELKMVSIAIRFAESKNLSLIKNYHPVLLIDDVLQELDETRKNLFFELISQEQQVIMVSSSKEASLSDKRLSVIFCRLHEGNVIFE